MGVRKPDFSGWATKANIRCSDGRTIAPGAFAHQSTLTVPLVWAHNHKDPMNVLGHAVLEDRGDDGVYMYGYFNETPRAQHSKELVKHKDVDSLSIWANQLKESAKRVMHGMIREVSLVLAGANPEAKIDNVVIAHADGFEEELEDTAIIEFGLELEHEVPSDEQLVAHAESAAKSMKEIYDSLTDEQNALFHHFIAMALTEDGNVEHSDEDAEDAEDNEQDNQNDDGAAGSDDNTEDENLEHQEGNETMGRRNLFDQGGTGATGGKGPEGSGGTLSHDDIAGFWEDVAENGGTFKRAIKRFAIAHGINDMEEILFPDARAVDSEPEWIKRQTEWVAGVLSDVSSRPFTRIKSRYADLTQDEARAKGYIKGTMKKEQFFGLTQRKTGPATIYKKQKLDRDDILDVNDFNMVDWMWGEMNLMIREEIARAILIGDGREIDDDDKVKDPNLEGATDTDGIRSILHDNDFYVTRVVVSIAAEEDNWEDVEDQVALARRFYKGTGSPKFYTTAETHTRLLLSRDGFGRKIHTGGDASLQTSLKVREIVDVEVMEGTTLEHNGDDLRVIGIIVNLADYVVGTDRGGELTKFDDFDIDFNQYKYLIESRLSGALIKAKSAIVILRAAAGDVAVEPAVPTFVAATGVVTIPTVTGVEYQDAADDSVLTPGAQAALAAGESITVQAVPTNGYFFSNDAEDSWTFTRPAA